MTKTPRKLTRRKPSPLVLTERDRLILEWVYRHRFLTTDHIQTITASKSRDKLNKRLKHLFDAKFLDRPIAQERLFAYTDKRPLVHALGNEGAKYIEEALNIKLPSSVYWTDKNRKVRSPKFLTHTLGTAEFFVSLHESIGSHDKIRLVNQAEVIAQAPARTQKLDFPLRLATEYKWFNGKHVRRSTVSDGIFALVDGRGEKIRTAFHFLEYDGSTMPIVRKTPNQSSIVQKMLGYADIYNRKLHVDRFGYKNFRVLFVTRGSDRIAAMIDAHNEHVRHLCPPGAFLFSDYDELMQHSPLGDVWADGKGGQTALVPQGNRIWGLTNMPE